MSIPEKIRKQKPTQFGALEIRCFGADKYYVYQITSKWDAAKNRPKKVTGKSIGKITETDGFIPNANGMRIMRDTNRIPETIPKVSNYGAYEMMRQLSPELETRLKEYFPESFREIRTLALIRLIDGVSSARMIQPVFLDSYMSELSNDLSLSESTVRRFITKLGTIQSRIDAFMCSMVLPRAKLLFDGTSIFSRSADSLSTKGYNSEHSQNTQARIMYVFDMDSHRPVFYRVIQGSIVDKASFIETVHAAGCDDCIIIADKGFYSKGNLSFLMAAGMKFILPLQDNTINVEPSFYENTDDHKWDGCFSYKKRIIWHRKRSSGSKGNFIYTFRDDIRKAEMAGTFVERVEKDYGEEECKTMDVLREIRMGYFSFCSNLDKPAHEIYLDYKQRWDIEQCFDYLKNSVSNAASHAQTDDYFRGWAFLNHISLLFYYGLINALHKVKLDDQYTAEDVIKLTKNIYRVSYDGKYSVVSEIQKKTQGILNTIGIDLLREN